MKILKEGDMKKVLILFALLFSSAICLSACNSGPSVQGEFNRDSYIVSLDDTINFYNDFSIIKGASLEDITFVSSNTEVLEKQEDESFTAMSSGQAIVFAQYHGETFAQTKVTVKYRLSSPSQLEINNDGVLTWSPSYATTHEGVVYADSYYLEYADITDNESPDPDEVTFVGEEVEDSFTFETGSYYVRITALSDNEYIDESLWTEPPIIVNNGVVGVIENISIVNSSLPYNTSSEISWDVKEGISSLYDVYLNGIMIFGNLNTNSFSYNFNLVEENEVLEIKVVAKDETGALLPTTTSFSLEKLIAPNVQYQGDGISHLTWNDIENASSYVMDVYNLVLGNHSYLYYDNEQNDEILFDGMSSGLYQINVSTLGDGNNGLYLNSNSTENILIAKLQTPDVDITFEDDKAILNFAKVDDYSNRYIISWANKSQIVTGQSCEIDLSDLASGNYAFKIRALPSLNAGEIVPYEQVGQNTTTILASDEFTYDFAILSDITNVTHQIENGGNSLFGFNEVQYANFYQISVNGTLIEDTDIDIQRGYVYIRIEDLSSFPADDNIYNVEVVAGLKNDSEEIAPRSTFTKVLTILDTVTESDEQTNGYYTWNALDNSYACYRYEIYSADNSYNITNFTAVQSGTTSENIIIEPLSFGYYVIRIYTVSTNTDEFLNSDFCDENNYFEAKFLVYEQIDSPNVTFSDENGYTLTIESTEFNGSYEIYVDYVEGAIPEGIIPYNPELQSDEVVYSLLNQFSEARAYTLAVIATAGDEYDGNLHTNSQPTLLTVTRLSVPELEFKSRVDRGVRSEEVTVENLEHTQYPIFKVDGSIVETNRNYTLNVSDQTIFDNEFMLTISYVAGEREGDSYYLDSHETSMTFSRVNYPKNISYSDSILSWDENADHTENYVITVTLTNSTNGNYYYTTQTDSANINLQELINDRCEQDASFATSYRQSESVQIQVFAYANNEIQGIYYIPSSYGTTVGGGNVLTLYRLDNPTLTFDPNTLLLSWNHVAQNTVYDIYVDGELVKEDYVNQDVNSNVTINISDLGDIDFTIRKAIYVIGKNAGYLTSAQSNTISIKELATIDSINVVQDDGQYLLVFNIDSDVSNTGAIHVNGSADNVNYQVGQNNGNIDLADFEDVDFAFQVIAQNSVSTNTYYINSKTTTFSLIDLSGIEFNVSLDNDIISWKGVANDFIGNNINPIKYILTVNCNSQSHTITTSQTSYNLQDIENGIGGIVLSGNVEIIVKAQVTDNYTLVLTGGQARGYYGSVQDEAIETEKLLQINSLSYEILDATDQDSLLNQKRNAYAVITWEDLWTDKQGVIFEITLYNENVATDETIYVSDGSTHTNYSLIKEDNNYKLTLQSAMFGLNDTVITIRTVCENFITSQPSTLTLQRLSQISNATINQDGLLTINDNANSAYIIQLSISDRLVEEKLDFTGQQSKTFDLMREGLLEDIYGYYTIAILSYDENGKKLPVSSMYLVTGTKLQGIESSQLDDYGFVNLVLYADNFTNLVFTARTSYNGEYITTDVIPVPTDTLNVYQVFIPTLIEQFSDKMSFQEGSYIFEITVSQQGYVRSDYHEFTFNYKVEKTLPTLLRQDFSQDYLILNIPEQDDTVGITMGVTYYNSTEGTAVDGQYFSYDATAVRGYLCTTVTGERYFTETRDDSLTDVTYEECYGVNLNSLLSDYDFGKFDIDIVRIGKGDDNVVNIYDSHKYQLYKLNRVIDDSQNIDTVRIDGSYLVWQWQAEDDFSSVSGYNASSYYITFYSVDDGESFRIMSYSSALDLSQIELVEGKAYYITVTALSNNNNILASSETQNRVQTLKYTQPLPIEVVDGTIVFNEEAFMDTRFMQDITNYFNSANPTYELFYIMGTQNYLAPYYFNLSIFGSQMLTLHFTALDSLGAETSVSYDMTIPGYMLFPDIAITNNNSLISDETRLSYIELLKLYADTLENSTESYAIYFRQTAEVLSQLQSHGLSSQAILFDDYGRTIPAGEYALSIRHEGGDGRYISSIYSTSTKIYLTPAPSVTLSQENDGTNNYYMATFGNTHSYFADNTDGNVSYTRGYVTSYKMILRPNYNNTNGLSYDENIVFDIIYSDGNWNVFYGGQNLTGVITNVNMTGMPGFKINMTVLREQYDALAQEPLIVNTLIRADVIASSSDNGYVPNGKSAIFYVRYLDLPTDSLTFQNGEMTIRTNLESSTAILVKYLATGSEAESMLIQINNGIANIDLQREGLYQYIVLSLNGSISYNTMNVESKSYAVENVYKLSAPDISTQNNNLFIQYNSADFSYTQDQSLQFMLANDISLAEGDGYYYQSTITRDDRNYITYSVGAIDSTGNVIFSSELNAQEFYAYLLGNSGIVQSSLAEEHTSHGADYIWTFLTMNADGSYIPARMLFTSEVSQIDARMLNVINQSPFISDGNIKWDIITDLPVIENGTVLYQVEVLYYNRVVGENEFDTTYDYITRDTYYTTNTMLDARFISQDYDYYIIEVTAFAGTLTNDDERAITTLENERYLLAESLYYQDEERQVLKGRTRTLGTISQPITRTNTPILAPNENVNNNGVSDGKIVYYITAEEYGNRVITESNSADTTSRTIIYATYTQSGQIFTVDLQGTFEYSTNSSTDISGYIMVVFTLDEGQLDGVNLLDINVQMYSNTGLLSKALVIDNIYRLSNFSDSYYEILLVGEQTVLDFTNYFRYISIGGGSSNYKIVIDYTTTSGNNQIVITRDSASKMFTITEDMIEINVQAQDNQSVSATSRLKILYSDTLKFVVHNTIVQEDGQDLISIAWDAELYRFVWNWTNGSLATDYEYYVQIAMQNNQTYSEVTSNNYFMPSQRGTIVNFAVRARHIGQESEGGTFSLYLFSQAVNYNEHEIDYNLFSGGDGSETSPYRISTAEDFYNISKRNTESEQFYFILTNNIILDNDMLLDNDKLIMEIFYGVLNGNGFAISISADRIYQLEDYQEDITGIGSIIFTSYFSLFKEISPRAVIENLAINFTVNTTALNESNLLISPLALENFGTLNNITINTITVSRLQGSGRVNNVFMGGIVGINYGTISSSRNNASFDYDMPQLLNTNFGYGAVAVINTSQAGYVGTISNTFNNGNVTVNVIRANVNIYLSGVVINNYSILEMVGNNGNFGQTSTVTCAAYFTGVALYSEGGTLSYVFNNGSFSDSSVASQNKNMAGIAYTLEGGQINYLADTKGYAIAINCKTSPRDTGTNYAAASSGTASNISTSALSNVEIDIGNGHSFVIRQNESVYTASIV